jgi:phosphoenolpyruvate---glycerone phosphotransferase subunit DhaL
VSADDDDADRSRAVSIVRAWIGGWAAAIAERRAWLTDLDAAIGDGDHGINLDRGLTAVAADFGRPDTPDEAGQLLAAAGRRLMGVVGGASGALYGRALLRAGEAVTGDPDPDRLGVTAIAAAIDAIEQLGKAVPGDKTMLDALVPALGALRADDVPGPDSYARAADAAEAGAEATVPLVARKGRASYLGDRSAGHRDPGAASSALLVMCLARAYAEHPG